MKRLSAVLVLALAACTPTQPTPIPNVTVVGCYTCGNSFGGGGGGASPSPGITTKPKLTKVTQYGENCPPSVAAGPSGQDRGVRVGCSKALTCSPKCDNPQGGPDIDCQVPQGGAPDEFRVFAGADRVSFTASTSNPAFNRDARGVAPGTASIDCTYAGVRSEPFDLAVVP
jgi:hypothetical protein